jgi:PAS domain S-box-containing protein
MEDDARTKEQLIGELMALRQQVAELEASEAEWKQTEQTLREAEARYRTACELTTDFAYAFRVEPDGTFAGEWLVGAFTRVTGFTHDEAVVHGRWKDLIHPEDRHVFHQHMQILLSGKPHVCEVRIITKSGEVRWLRNHARPVWDQAQERVAHIFGAARDITDRVRVEKEREWLILQLQEVLDEVKILSGLLPICASCKKIRDDEGYWQQVEVYVREHSEAEFTHSICPECAKRLYPGLFEGDK